MDGFWNNFSDYNIDKAVTQNMSFKELHKLDKTKQNDCLYKSNHYNVTKIQLEEFQALLTKFQNKMFSQERIQAKLGIKADVYSAFDYEADLKKEGQVKLASYFEEQQLDQLIFGLKVLGQMNLENLIFEDPDKDDQQENLADINKIDKLDDDEKKQSIEDTSLRQEGSPKKENDFDSDQNIDIQPKGPKEHSEMISVPMIISGSPGKRKRSVHMVDELDEPLDQQQHQKEEEDETNQEIQKTFLRKMSSANENLDSLAYSSSRKKNGVSQNQQPQKYKPFFFILQQFGQHCETVLGYLNNAIKNWSSFHMFEMLQAIYLFDQDLISDFDQPNNNFDQSPQEDKQKSLDYLKDQAKMEIFTQQIINMNLQKCGPLKQALACLQSRQVLNLINKFINIQPSDITNCNKFKAYLNRFNQSDQLSIEETEERSSTFLDQFTQRRTSVYAVLFQQLFQTVFSLITESDPLMKEFRQLSIINDLPDMLTNQQKQENIIQNLHNFIIKFKENYIYIYRAHLFLKEIFESRLSLGFISLLQERFTQFVQEDGQQLTCKLTRFFEIMILLYEIITEDFKISNESIDYVVQLKKGEIESFTEFTCELIQICSIHLDFWISNFMMKDGLVQSDGVCKVRFGSQTVAVLQILSLIVNLDNQRIQQLLLDLEVIVKLMKVLSVTSHQDFVINPIKNFVLVVLKETHFLNSQTYKDYLAQNSQEAEQNLNTKASDNQIQNQEEEQISEASDQVLKETMDSSFIPSFITFGTENKFYEEKFQWHRQKKKLSIQDIQIEVSKRQALEEINQNIISQLLSTDFLDYLTNFQERCLDKRKRSQFSYCHWTQLVEGAQNNKVTNKILSQKQQNQELLYQYDKHSSLNTQKQMTSVEDEVTETQFYIGKDDVMVRVDQGLEVIKQLSLERFLNKNEVFTKEEIDQIANSGLRSDSLSQKSFNSGDNEIDISTQLHIETLEFFK